MESGEVGERDDLGLLSSVSGNFCPCSSEVSDVYLLPVLKRLGGRI